jgi:Mlc titration factor MtfA (ptsG expression regulator)
MFAWLRRWRRDALRRRPFPAEWRAFIEKNVPYVGCLPPEDRKELFEYVQVFLAEKHFEGCGGLQLTDEVRVTIAAQACVLLLHRQTEVYPQLVSILVYPTTYLAPGGVSAGGI